MAWCWPTIKVQTTRQVINDRKKCVVCDYKQLYIYIFFYIHGSVHRNSILIRSNKMQQYAGMYLLQNHSTCFGCPSNPSSGVHKHVTAACGTGHSIWATTFIHRGQIKTPWRPNLATLDEGCWSDNMTCTRGLSYSFMYSWWWVRWTPKTCRVILQ